MLKRPKVILRALRIWVYKIMRVTWTESVLIKDREHTFVCTPCGNEFVITCEQDRRVNIKTASCLNFALRGADVVRELFYAG